MTDYNSLNFFIQENNHPLTPPLELVRQWALYNNETDLERFWMRLATQAARWGADQKLKAALELAEVSETLDVQSR